VLRKDWNGVEGTEGDVFYFGIVDVLQACILLLISHACILLLI